MRKRRSQSLNDSDFGLGAGVWTEDMRRAIRVSHRLEAGSVYINSYRVVSFMSPFGGYKHSGLGRENGVEAIREYLQTKSVWISAQRDRSGAVWEALRLIRPS